jgi:hypothetical protein
MISVPVAILVSAAIIWTSMFLRWAVRVHDRRNP